MLARDVTHDPANGLDAHAWAQATAARKDRRVAYLISNRMIWWPMTGWRRYYGVNGHTKHAHISIHNTAAARNDTSPWWPPVTTPTAPTEEDDMATPDARRGLVEVLYLAALGRRPTEPDRTAWSQHIADHGLEATAAAIADSDEGKARRGGGS